LIRIFDKHQAAASVLFSGIDLKLLQPTELAEIGKRKDVFCWAFLNDSAFDSLYSFRNENCRLNHAIGDERAELKRKAAETAQDWSRSKKDLEIRGGEIRERYDRLLGEARAQVQQLTRA
jgi:hypothetical protein